VLLEKGKGPPYSKRGPSALLVPQSSSFHSYQRSCPSLLMLESREDTTAGTVDPPLFPYFPSDVHELVVLVVFMLSRSMAGRSHQSQFQMTSPRGSAREF
jgi:hypothetical protein